MSPAGIFGSGGLYVQVAGIGDCFAGQKYENIRDTIVVLDSKDNKTGVNVVSYKH